MQPFSVVSPIDGRYRNIASRLIDIFSDEGYKRYCVRIECEYLIALSKQSGVGVRDFTPEEVGLLRSFFHLSFEEAQVIRDIEEKGYNDIPRTRHDVKAIEYFLKEWLNNTSLADVCEWIHFGLTSDDVKNIAYALMLSDGVGDVLLPALETLAGILGAYAEQYAGVPMLARTHEQPASPTTVGKEFNVFRVRMLRLIQELRGLTITAKLNGATGNYNAHAAAYPDIHWPVFSCDFITSFNGSRTIRLEPNFVTTQIDSHDSYARLFDLLRRVNTVIIDCNQDMSRYLSDGWFLQNTFAGEVGSSTMPHKVNPQDFETSIGNLGVAGALLEFFSRKLPISRLQRDASDYSVKRYIGEALGACLVGYVFTIFGLQKIVVNEEKIRADLDAHPEVLTEAIQTILRREGIPAMYEELRDMARGKKITMADLHEFINRLPVTDAVRNELLNLTPSNYTERSEELSHTKYHK